MGYRIRYFRKTAFVEDCHWDKSLSEARIAAADWLILHGAENAAIWDTERGDKPVARVAQPGREPASGDIQILQS